MSLYIPDFRTASVLVAGDVMLDEYWFGDAQRISPEAPVPVVHIRDGEERPGGAANVALNLSSLGAVTELAGVIGDDDRGRRLEALLQERSVRCRFIVSDRVPTIHKLRVLARNQQLIRLDAEQTLSSESAGLADVSKDGLETCQALVLSDYAKGSLSAVEDFIAAARAAGKPVLVDPKGQDFRPYRGATVVTPNMAEFQAVVGPVSEEGELVSRAQQLCSDLSLSAVLVTRGERGMTLVMANGNATTLAAESREVFDVTGAGDTVIAMLAATLALDGDLETAARLANLAAGLVVRKIGAATVTPSELRLALHRRGAGGRGLVDRPELIQQAAAARDRGERLVMTNGCFDILHAGHVAYLEEAKGLGNRLIVAVNDDMSVARLKGQGRPVCPLEDRMAVLAGLAAVDWVVPFSEDTPAGLIEEVLPDILVKGGDYEVSEIAGGPAVLANGGEVRVLAFRPGRSTTAMIEAIRGG